MKCKNCGCNIRKKPSGGYTHSNKLYHLPKWRGTSIGHCECENPEPENDAK